MNGNCLDIGTIQAFLDGETRPETALKISEHVADCDACAILLAQAEEESSQVFSVLDRELNTLVPTQRLWSRINESIAVEKSRSSVWQRFMTFVTANLVNPSFATAAGVLLVVGMFAAVWNMRTEQVAVAPDLKDEVVRPQAPLTPSAGNPSPVSGPEPGTVPTGVVKPTMVGASKLSDEELRRLAQRVNSDRQPRPQYLVDRYLPGEESYIKTIGELEQNVTVQNASMSASGQVSYQRNMAVVDDAIKKMKEVVRKNPKNQAARQVLYSSYQDKIDLLNSAAQREELMASLK